MIFQCKRCSEVFESDGVQVIVHGKNVGRVCPACIANADRITLVIERAAPNKPYELVYTNPETGIYEVNPSDDHD